MIASVLFVLSFGHGGGGGGPSPPPSSPLTSLVVQDKVKLKINSDYSLYFAIGSFNVTQVTEVMFQNDTVKFFVQQDPMSILLHFDMYNEYDNDVYNYTVKFGNFVSDGDNFLFPTEEFSLFDVGSNVSSCDDLRSVNGDKAFVNARDLSAHYVSQCMKDAWYENKIMLLEFSIPMGHKGRFKACAPTYGIPCFRSDPLPPIAPSPPPEPFSPQSPLSPFFPPPSTPGSRRLSEGGVPPAPSSTPWSFPAPPPPPSLPALSPPPGGQGNGDPHLKFAHGGTADFRGEDGVLYNFLSAPGIALNVKTEDVDFWTKNHSLLVHGSLMTEAHVVTPQLQMSYWASKIGDAPVVWINGTCGGAPFRMGPKQKLTCGDANVTTGYSRACVTTSDWNVSVLAQSLVPPVWDMITPKKNRLDVEISKRSNVISHGILGQGFTREKRQGKTDKYPEHGEFTTMIDMLWILVRLCYDLVTSRHVTTIEGTHEQYKVSSEYAVNTHFSLFHSERHMGFGATLRALQPRSTGAYEAF